MCRLISSARWHQDKLKAAVTQRRQEVNRLTHLVEQLRVQDELELERHHHAEQAYRDWLQRHGTCSVPSIPDTRLSCHRTHDSSTSNSSLSDDAKLRAKYSENHLDQRTLPCSKTKWNHSTKVPKKSYLRHLYDHYPRDQFTKLPVCPAHRHTLSPAMKAAIKEHRRGRNVKSSRALSYDQLKAQADPVILLDPSLSLKPALFKSKTILDVDRRRHYSAEAVHLTEVPLHLTDDSSSWLFRSALLPSNQQTTTTSSN